MHGFTDGVGQINEAGIDHYNKLINALLAKGILLNFVAWF